MISNDNGDLEISKELGNEMIERVCADDFNNFPQFFSSEWIKCKNLLKRPAFKQSQKEIGRTNLTRDILVFFQRKIFAFDLILFQIQDYRFLHFWLNKNEKCKKGNLNWKIKIIKHIYFASDSIIIQIQNLRFGIFV